MSDMFISIGIGIGTVIGSCVMYMGNKVFKLYIDSKQRIVLQEAIMYGLGWAVEHVKFNSGGVVPSDSKKRIISLAAAYVNEMVPDAIEHFKIDKGSKRLKQLGAMVDARLPATVFKNTHTLSAATDEEREHGGH